MPRWLDHVKTRALVFDGDNVCPLLHRFSPRSVISLPISLLLGSATDGRPCARQYFLHVQERILAQEAAAGRPWKKRYFMPTVADRCLPHNLAERPLLLCCTIAHCLHGSFADRRPPYDATTASSGVVQVRHRISGVV